MARTANRRERAEEASLSKESRNSFKTAIYTRISRDKKENKVAMVVKIKNSFTL